MVSAESSYWLVDDHLLCPPMAFPWCTTAGDRGGGGKRKRQRALLLTRPPTIMRAPLSRLHLIPITSQRHHFQVPSPLILGLTVSMLRRHKQFSRTILASGIKTETGIKFSLADAGYFVLGMSRARNEAGQERCCMRISLTDQAVPRRSSVLVIRCCTANHPRT